MLKVSLVLVVLCTIFGAAAHAAADGPALFLANCSPCHGPDGRAKTPAAKKLAIKDLVQSKLTEADIQKQIVQGSKRPEPRRQMPAFEGKLTADEVKALAQFVKTLQK